MNFTKAIETVQLLVERGMGVAGRPWAHLAKLKLIGLFSDTISIRSQMTQCRIIPLLQPITKLYLFTMELKLPDDFRCFRSKMYFRRFSTVRPRCKIIRWTQLPISQ